MSNVLSFIARYAPADFRSRVDSLVNLSELHLNAFDRFYSLPIALEEAFGIELTDDEISSWVTARDVERSVSAPAY